MKILLSACLALAATSIPASAITIATPANGATLGSPFKLVASTSTCGSVPAVSMGYSIDSGSATIEPTSFSAMVTATSGPHVLHVKCWGVNVHDETLLDITVGTAATSDITVMNPASGTNLSSPFTVAASSKTCNSAPTAAMGYSIDSGLAIIEPTPFSATATAAPGAHILHVKCWGKGTHNETLLNITVVKSNPPAAATPQFSLASGQYSTRQSVSLSDATPGAVIYYTTDDSGPTTSSPKYAGPISIASSTVIEAIAVASGYSNSGLARASYSIVLPSGPNIPPNAVHVDEIQTLPNWNTKYDPGTGGPAEGEMSMVSTPSLSGDAAKYVTNYSSYGGVLYSVNYGNDSDAHNFVYDAHVWIEAGSQIGNLEMDNNQVVPNGDTIIYAFQCSGIDNAWDYTENAGTPGNPVAKWVQSAASCNPASWTTNVWHHVQIYYSRDDSGNVTYHSVWLDGVETPINETVMSDFSLNWGSGALVANFQVDGGVNGGSSTLYLDNFSVYRW